MQKLAKSLEFLQNHWRKVLAVSVCVGCFFLGRSTAPEAVRIEEKVVFKDKIVEKVVTVEVEKKTAAEVKVVYRDRYVAPSGAVSERTEERTETKTDETRERGESFESVRVQYVDREVKVTSDRPVKNHASLLVGYDSRPAVWKYMNISGVTIGVHYERRIFETPLWVGVWAIHTGAVGASVGAEW